LLPQRNKRDERSLKLKGPTMFSDLEVLERFPNTLIDHDSKDYYRGLLEKQILMSKCQDCGNWQSTLRSICPECWSTNVKPTPIAGTGTVHLLIYLHQGPDIPGVSYQDGYPVAAIELDEQVGLRFVSTIIDYDKSTLKVGSRVKLDWITRDGNPFPAFRPVEN
jgi:hypothetical protein